MVAEMLSQEEINALLGSTTKSEGSSGSLGQTSDRLENHASNLSPDEIDVLGVMGNISMGTAATTLFTLLNHKVFITTQKVEALTWDQFVATLTDDLTAVAVDYTEGFSGLNLMMLRDDDVKVITDLMMGGTGNYIEGPVTDLQLSTISEAMNQMIGSSLTSITQVFNKKINISQPQAFKIGNNVESIFGAKGDFVKISFRLQIEENIMDSELMQIIPLQFAKELISGLMVQEKLQTQSKSYETTETLVQPAPQAPPHQVGTMPIYEQPIQTSSIQPNMQQNYQNQSRQEGSMRPDVDIKSPQFQTFDSSPKVYPKENMDILMDVSLEVSVELGRTSRKIKDILEFGPGSIIELNRLVGEPVDVLVNGKFVATGEVVVIDENFGIRITDIINPENRI